MDKLKSMQVFIYVAENGSFRSAANHFELSATMIGKHIQFLETSLETRLLNRTTRKQSLTESGRVYLEECKRIISDISLAENRIQTLENTPMGTIKINCPVTLGSEWLAPLVAKFLQNYPQLDIEMTVDNSIVDPLSSDADILIRIGELHDSALIARKLGEYRVRFCASPDYLANNQPIRDLEDLKHHACLGFVFSQGQTMQSLKLDTDAFNRNKTRFASNNGHVLKAAALESAGIILQPHMLVEKELQQGQLVTILEEFEPQPKPIYLLFRSRALSLKTRTLVDYLVESMTF